MTRVLVLGGTAWLGGRVAAAWLARGAQVTCLARGTSGPEPKGTRLVRADRTDPGAYQAVADQDWDKVVELSYAPPLVTGALDALASRARHWTLVSTISVYTNNSEPGATRTPHFCPWWTQETTDRPRPPHILLVPESDWPAIRPLHTEMAVLPAIANGCTVVRPTRRGRSAAIDPHGRFVATADHVGRGGAPLWAEVPGQRAETPYARLARRALAADGRRARCRASTPRRRDQAPG